KGSARLKPFSVIAETSGISSTCQNHRPCLFIKRQPQKFLLTSGGSKTSFRNFPPSPVGRKKNGFFFQPPGSDDNASTPSILGNGSAKPAGPFPAIYR